MSRFVELLQQHDQEISLANFRDMLGSMTRLLNADSGCIEMTFPFFLHKTAPVSGVKSLMDYEVTFIGISEQGNIRTDLRLVVPVTSLCPCSKEISEYGAHNQRSHVVLHVQLYDFIWIEELIELAESCSSGQLYGLLKRPDEKYVTEHAYENPKFVEDIVRDIATQCNKDKRIAAYTVEAENFESIHNHSAYALLSSNKNNNT